MVTVTLISGGAPSSSDGDAVDNNLQLMLHASILSGGRCSLKEANDDEEDDFVNWLLSNVDGDRR